MTHCSVQHSLMAICVQRSWPKHQHILMLTVCKSLSYARDAICPTERARLGGKVWHDIPSVLLWMGKKQNKQTKISETLATSLWQIPHKTPKTSQLAQKPLSCFVTLFHAHSNGSVRIAMYTLTSDHMEHEKLLYHLM